MLMMKRVISTVSGNETMERCRRRGIIREIILFLCFGTDILDQKHMIVYFEWETFSLIYRNI